MPAQALERARSLVIAAPRNAAAWLSFGEVLYRLGAHADAVTAFAKGKAFASEPAAALHYAKGLAANGEFSAALNEIEPFLDQPQLDVDALNLLNQIMTRAGKHHEALGFAQRAAESLPDDPTIRYNFAMAQRACGQMDDAIASLDRVIEMEPNNWGAWKNRSDLKRWSGSINHIAALRAVQPDSAVDRDGFIQTCAALAKELEDIGDNAAAFSCLKAGAAARRAQIDYDVNRDLAMMAAISAHFSQQFFDAPATSPPNAMPVPIFILGLPRSGSTLLERIISASPSVTPCGELPDLSKLFTRLARRAAGGRPVSPLELPELSTQLDFAELATLYGQAAKARGVSTQYFTDKLPTNFLNIGLIFRAFPHARIIHIYRQPMAAGFAIYKNFFGDAYPYAYDLGEIASYFAAYQQLMQHWRQVLPPGRILDVGYEQLVSDSGASCSRIFEYLGLEWRSEFLNVDLLNTPTDTASAAQVRQPINRNSVDAWQKVATQLKPLREALLARGVDVSALP